jgi:IS30 family transposase
MQNLFKMMVEKEPSKYPTRMGQKWDEDEELKLLTFVQQKKSVNDIAKELSRTSGGIRKHLRRLALEYWFGDKLSIKEISRITGMTHSQIENDIQKKKNADKAKAESNTTEPSENPSEMSEMISLLKEMNSKLSLLLERIQ